MSTLNAQGPVVVLAGGTGGAKLARGLHDLAGDDLVVIANTGDDIEIHGGHVSPDPDLVSFWLADRIDARGWGLDGDTFAVMDELRALGDDVWFNLGDRDLAFCVRRARRLAEGATLTEALAEQTAALGLGGARVLPMSDEPVRTRVLSGEHWVGLQEFLIGMRGAPVDGVELQGVDAARPTDAVLEAIASARAIVIGPSNPIISIGPILALPGMREALTAAPAPVVAMSPIVGGAVLKGPTEAFLRWTGREATGAAVLSGYLGLLDGFVADEPIEGAPVPVLVTPTDLGDADARQAVALQTLRFAVSLA